MGLDAHVYLRREFIQAAHLDALRLDEDTGEVYYAHQANLRDDFNSEAVHIRLGNIANIAGLRHELCPPDANIPIICAKILYSGSHAGDWIEFALIDDLAHEVARLRARTDLSSYAVIFLDSLDALILASRDQRNPIVF